jgi:hypothetical protein
MEEADIASSHDNSNSSLAILLPQPIYLQTNIFWSFDYIFLQCREMLSARAFRNIFCFSVDFPETLTESAFQENRRDLVKNPEY